MKTYFEYMKYLLRHKWYVFRAGIKIGAPLWALIIHDLDKFYPLMIYAYANMFFPGDAPSYLPQSMFDRALNYHLKNNRHHWQYWITVNSYGNITMLEIPQRFVKEMVADWIGAGLAKGEPEVIAWYEKNREGIIMHPASQLMAEQYLYGYAGMDNPWFHPDTYNQRYETDVILSERRDSSTTLSG